MGFIPHGTHGEREIEPGLFGVKLVDGSEGAGEVSLLRGWLHPGALHPPHVHEVEEAIVFLEGHGTQSIGDEEREVGPGDALIVPAGVVHSTLNTGEKDLVWIAAYPENVIEGRTLGREQRPGFAVPLRNRMAWMLSRIAHRLNPAQRLRSAGD